MKQIFTNIIQNRSLTEYRNMIIYTEWFQISLNFKRKVNGYWIQGRHLCHVFVSLVLKIFLLRKRINPYLDGKYHKIVGISENAHFYFSLYDAHILLRFNMTFVSWLHRVVIHETLYNFWEGRLDHIRKFARHISDVRCFVCSTFTLILEIRYQILLKIRSR